MIDLVIQAKKSGFTLLELICVIAILSILTLISYPSFDKLNNLNQLDIATNELICDMRLAKMYAVTNNRVSVKMMFVAGVKSGTFNGYKIYYTNQNFKTIYLVARTISIPIVIDGTRSTFMNGGIGNNLEFYTTGAVNLPCTIVLKDLTDNRSKTITLTIGFTRIEVVQ